MRRLIPHFGDRVRDELVRISIFTAIAALLLFAVVSSLYGVLQFRAQAIERMAIHGKMTASGVSAAVSFGSRKDAEETLSYLGSDPRIVRAAVVLQDGTVFAEYLRGDAGGRSLPPVSLRHGVDFGFRHQTLFQPVVLDGLEIGSVYILRDQLELYRYLIWLAVLVIFLSSACIYVAFAVLARLQRRITEPIQELADTIDKITQSADYAVRAPVQGARELQMLAAGFNEMLSEIEERDSALEKRKDELASAKVKLEWELEERQRTEHILRESEERYRTIFENTGTAAIITNDNGLIILANTEFANLTGYERKRIEGAMKLERLIVEIGNVFELMSDKGVEIRLLDAGGNTKHVIFTVTQIPGTKDSICTFLDVTERKKLEQQLLQSNKMEAIGQLAGGVAHDFNNILMAIVGYGNLLLMEVKTNHTAREYIDNILQAADRAAELTKGLLAFSRRGLIARASIGVNDIIRDVQKLLFRLIGEDVKLNVRLYEKEATVVVDAAQIQQVIMSLAANARDAMPNGGTLSIETGVVELSRGTNECPEIQNAGIYAQIVVADSGTGIDEKTRQRIFEPFFTTKDVGKGTGLGLAIAYGIVKQHGGGIVCQSELGKGSTFKIFLPVFNVVPEKVHSRFDHFLPRSARKTILLAEDDEAVRTLTKKVLTSASYRVIECQNGVEAVRLFRQHKDEIDLMLLDVIMPEKNGRQVFEEARRERPDIRAVFISGYPDSIIGREMLDEQGLTFVNKPIAPAELLKKISIELGDDRS